MDTGRMVKRIWWNGVDGDQLKSAKQHEHMVTLKEFYGDHDEDWILLVDSGTGKEIERYNAKYLALIEWA